jgi:hypothetical protein
MPEEHHTLRMKGVAAVHALLLLLGAIDARTASMNQDQ